MQFTARIQQFAPSPHPSLANKMRAPPYGHRLTTAYVYCYILYSTLSRYISRCSHHTFLQILTPLSHPHTYSTVFPFKECPSYTTVIFILLHSEEGPSTPNIFILQNEKVMGMKFFIIYNEKVHYTK
jgi:hypothetical protein